MAKNKPVVVTITEGKHKTQPWTFSIDRPGNGPDDSVRERYTRMWTAKVGALRKLNAYHILQVEGSRTVKVWYDHTGVPIQFVVKPKTTKSK